MGPRPSRVLYHEFYNRLGLIFVKLLKIGNLQLENVLKIKTF